MIPWWLSLLLWPLSGLLGWAWLNHSIFMRDGLPTRSDAQVKNLYLLCSPFLGPTLVMVNLILAILERRLYWGLRFR